MYILLRKLILSHLEDFVDDAALEVYFVHELSYGDLF